MTGRQEYDRQRTLDKYMMDIFKIFLNIFMYTGARAVCVYGGTGISEQIAELKRGMSGIQRVQYGNIQILCSISPFPHRVSAVLNLDFLICLTLSINNCVFAIFDTVEIQYILLLPHVLIFFIARCVMFIYFLV